MVKSKTARKEMNGVFLLLTIVKGAVMGLSYLISWLLFKAADNQKLYSEVSNLLGGYDSVTGILFNFGIYALAAGIPLLAYLALRGKGKDTYYDGLLLSRPTLSQVGAALGPTVLISGAVSYIGNILISYFYYINGYGDLITETGTPTNVWLMPAFFVLAAVMPALAEEFIMRGALLGRTKNLGRGFAVFLSGLVFMMMHNTLEQMPLAFAAGMCLAYFTLKFNSIWVAVIIHFIINLNSCVVSVLYETFEGADMLFAYMVYSLMYFTLMLALSVAGPIMYGVGLPKAGKASKQDKKGRLGLLLRSPCFYVYIALFLLMLYLNIKNVIG